MTTKTKDPMGDLQEVRSSFIKWGAVGDWIKGTLVSVREVESRLPGKEGEMQKIYEIKAEAGVFHNIDESKKVATEPTLINTGEYWNIGGKPAIDNSFRNIRVGQIVGLRFAEETPSKTKGFNPNKVIKVLAGSMDPNWTGEDSTMKEIDTNDLP